MRALNVLSFGCESSQCCNPLLVPTLWNSIHTAFFESHTNLLVPDSSIVLGTFYFHWLKTPERPHNLGHHASWHTHDPATTDKGHANVQVCQDKSSPWSRGSPFVRFPRHGGTMDKPESLGLCKSEKRFNPFYRILRPTI